MPEGSDTITRIKDKTLLGFSWSMFSQAGRYSTLIIVNIILARILTPREFGQMAMITVVTGFAEIVSEMGWGAAIIRNRDMGDGPLSSIFWLNIFSGLIVMVLLVLSAPWIAYYNREQSLIPLILLVSLTFLINSPSIVPKALFKRRLDFKRLAIIEIFSGIIAGVLAVILALRGFGVWSLAAHFLSVSVFSTAFTWALTDWRPGAVLQRDGLRSPAVFGTSLTLESLLNYVSLNLDNLLIGLVLGADALGIYSKAYFIITFPKIFVSSIPGRVIFPSFSMIPDDKPRIKSIFLKVSQSVALLTFPMMIGLLVTAPEFVHVAFGDQWSSMVPTLRILVLVGMIQSVSTLVGNIFLAQGRADLLLRLGIFLKAIQILAVLIGLRWGIEGVAAGLLFSSILTTIPYIYYGGGLIGLSMGEYFKSFGLISVCTLVMFAGVIFVELILPPGSGSPMRLLAKTSAGILCYWGLLHITGADAWIQVKEIISDHFRLRRT